MCDYWVNFIRTGNPNGLDSQGEQLPEWPVFAAEAPEWMRFGREVRAESCAQDELVGLLLEYYLKGREN